jgi:thymidylate kinase
MEQSKFSIDLEKLRTCFTAHEEPGRLVVFEGIPGAGKTTVSKLLASRNNLLLLPELDHVTALNTQGEVLKDDLVEGWYVKTELARQLAIREQLEAGKYVFQDRSILSTLAFAYARSMVDNDYLRFERVTERLTKAVGNKLLLPDAVVLLFVDQRISLERRRRFSRQRQFALWFDTEFLSHYEAFYQRYAHQVMPTRIDRVDTSHLSPRNLAGLLTHALLERGCLPPNRGEANTTVEGGK